MRPIKHPPGDGPLAVDCRYNICRGQFRISEQIGAIGPRSGKCLHLGTGSKGLDQVPHLDHQVLVLQDGLDQVKVLSFERKNVSSLTLGVDLDVEDFRFRLNKR